MKKFMNTSNCEIYDPSFSRYRDSQGPTISLNNYNSSNAGSDISVSFLSKNIGGVFHFFENIEGHVFFSSSSVEWHLFFNHSSFACRIFVLI